MASKNVSHQQRAYEYILGKILSMEYNPGDQITDSKIAKELKISRTPVREGIQLLENEGLLIPGPRRGWRVYSLTIKDIEDIFDLKCEIEGLMAGRAAEDPDEHHRDALRELLHKMKNACENSDVEKWTAIDSSLHHLIYVMAQNDRAEKIINNLNNQWHRLRKGYINLQGNLCEATFEHEKIVQAIEGKNPMEAEKAMHEHLNSLRNGLMKVLVSMILPYARNGL